METLTRDLHSYELVLLGLGVFLFLILSIGLIYYILKKQEIKKLLFFFPISIIMIGYPSIKEISISHDRIEFSKYQKAYASNPEDTIARQELVTLVEKLEDRASTPEDILQISNAKLLLGNTTEAIHYADKAIDIDKKEKTIPAIISDRDYVSTNDNTSKTHLTYAEQIKYLAKAQENAVKYSDTISLNRNIQNIVLDKELLQTQQVVRKNALRKIRQSNN